MAELLSDLPPELVGAILGCLTVPSACEALSACKNWRTARPQWTKITSNLQTANILGLADQSFLTEINAPSGIWTRQITNDFLSQICAPNLSVLTLANCMALTSHGLVHLKRFPLLRELDLTCCYITDLSYLSALGNLQRLVLKRNYILNQSLAHLQGLSSLTDLDLALTRIGDEGISFLDGIQLKKLDLSYTEVTDAGLRVVATMTSLEQLALVHLGITDAGLGVLGALEKMQHLKIGGCFQITSLDRLVSWQELRSLNMSACFRITNSIWPALSRFAKLEELNVESCRALDAWTFDKLKPTLVHLTLFVGSNGKAHCEFSFN